MSYEFTFLQPIRKVAAAKVKEPKISLTANCLIFDPLATKTFKPKFAMIGLAKGTQPRTAVLCVRPCEETSPCAMPFVLSGARGRGKLRFGAMLSAHGIVLNGKNIYADCKIIVLTADEIILEVAL